MARGHGTAYHAHRSHSTHQTRILRKVKICPWSVVSCPLFRFASLILDDSSSHPLNQQRTTDYGLIFTIVCPCQFASRHDGCADDANRRRGLAGCRASSCDRDRDDAYAPRWTRLLDESTAS